MIRREHSSGPSGPTSPWLRGLLRVLGASGLAVAVCLAVIELVAVTIVISIGGEWPWWYGYVAWKAVFAAWLSAEFVSLIVNTVRKRPIPGRRLLRARMILATLALLVALAEFPFVWLIGLATVPVFDDAAVSTADIVEWIGPLAFYRIVWLVGVSIMFVVLRSNHTAQRRMELLTQVR